MRLVFVVALTTTLSALPAAAQQPPAPPPQGAPGKGQPARPPLPSFYADPIAMMIAGFDSDGDGRVTRAEFDAGVRRSFDAIDTRRSGKLGYIAFGDWAERWLGNRDAPPSPYEVDRDGDGFITFAELAGRFDAYFTQFDKNGDGAIDRSELLTVRPMTFNEPAARGKRGRGGSVPPADERRD